MRRVWTMPCTIGPSNSNSDRCFKQEFAARRRTRTRPQTSSTPRENPCTTKLTPPPPPSIFGFLLGSTLSGAAVYYYILEEYRVSNELLTEDIYVRLLVLLLLFLSSSFLLLSLHLTSESLANLYPGAQALQSAVQRIESYTRSLEEKIVEMQTKRLQS